MSKKHPHSTLRFNSYWMLWVLVVPEIICQTLIGAAQGFATGIDNSRTAFLEWKYYNT